MPPIHPAIVHFPIALVTLSVLTDLFGYLYDNNSLRGAGWWSLAGAAIGGGLAVIAGLFDMNREKIQHSAHERVHAHMKVGFTVFAAVAALTLWRWAIYMNLANGVGRIYLIVAFLVFGLTMFQGYLGGELVFADGVGVAPTGQGTESPEKAKERVSNVADEDKKGGHRH